MSTNTGAEKKGKLSGKGSNLALQAGILAGAGIVSRIMGIMDQHMPYMQWSS